MEIFQFCFSKNYFKMAEICQYLQKEKLQLQHEAHTDFFFFETLKDFLETVKVKLQIYAFHLSNS